MNANIICKSTSSSQCCKTFAGLYLQVCKYRTNLINTCSLYFCQIPDGYARQLEYLVFKSETSLNMGNRTIFVFTDYVKTSPVFTDL